MTTTPSRIAVAAVLMLAFGGPLVAEEPIGWIKQEKAILGPSRPVAVVYAPTVERWMALGYQFPPGVGQRKPTTYDEVAFDPAEGQWENWYPHGKDWGPKFGDAKAPGWKGERMGLKDADGNVRPNWAAWYWLLGAGHNYAWDSDGKRFLFYINGSTFAYDPAGRQWKDLAPAGDPQAACKSQLLWGSICYDEARKQVVLFGGGNAQTERGDPGTWTYSPATNTWTELKLDIQPPPRANSALVYDPVSKKVILFGGDHLDRLTADTWTFDGTKWEQRHPAVTPSPRAGHALVWLPKARKILLVGGYGYTSTTEYYGDVTRSLPLEAWTYDVGADRWDLVQRVEPAKKGAPPIGPTSPAKFGFQVAVDPNDQVAAVDANRVLWTWNASSLTPDAAGTSTYGAKPGAVERRKGAYDPAWYAEGVPAADPAKVEAELKAIPTNRWVRRTPPKTPKPNTDWGSAIYAVDSDQIIRFSGGHAAYSGTAPHVYDIKTDRWSIPFAPEMPIEFCYGNDGTPGDWSFGGNPWMTGHTYKATGYDPNLKGLVFGAHKYSYLFDPKAGAWSRFLAANPYRASFYTTSLIPTPKGLVAWAHGGTLFWRLNAKEKTWEPLPVKGPIFAPICDDAGMAYDSNRDRMLAFARSGPAGSKIATYDLTTGEAKAIEATGADKVQETFHAAQGKGHFEFRESVYLPEIDMVMNGATGMFFDCAKNAWFAATIPSDSPDLAKHPSYNLGVMVDSRRNLVWAVDTNCNVYVMRVDPATLKLRGL
jgi:Galactose oxidase, central domain